MNERIKELAEQAYAVCGKHSNNYNGPEFSAKFAELIVKECAAEADKCAERGSWMAARRIKQHFGVEE